MTTQERIQPPVYSFNTGTLAPVKNLFLRNGVPVFLIESGTEDVMRIEFVFRAGQVNESVALQASTTNMMLTEGSEKYSSEEINRLLDRYGVFHHLSAEKDTAGMVMFVLNKYTEKVIELAGEILYNPVFPEKEFEILMKKRLRWYLVSREKVQNLATEKFFESLFGSNHPYGRQISENDFENLNTNHIKDFYTSFYVPGNMTVIISGKTGSDTLELIDKYMGGISSGKASYGEMKKMVNGSPIKKVHINKPGALQSSVRIGSATINKRHPEYPGLKVLNSLLGGYFGSRLMKNIREEKGYTYGIHSSASSLVLSGYKIISAEVSNKITQKAIDEIYKEIRILQTEQVNSEELDVVRNYMSGEMVRMFDGPFAMAESFKAIWEFDLDVNYYHKLAGTIRSINPDAIMQLANKYYNIDDLYEIVAG